MKKYVSSFLIGVLLTLPLTSYADGISKIGKVIKSEFVVLLNGEEMPVKAIAFEGTSYVPVRVIGETLGLDVDFKDNEIILTSKEKRKEGEKLTSEKIKGEIRVLDSYISLYERKLKPYEDEDVQKMMEDEAKENPSYDEVLQQRTEKRDELRSQLNSYLEHKRELERQLDELEQSEPQAAE